MDLSSSLVWGYCFYFQTPIVEIENRTVYWPNVLQFEKSINKWNCKRKIDMEEWENVKSGQFCGGRNVYTFPNSNELVLEIKGKWFITASCFHAYLLHLAYFWLKNNVMKYSVKMRLFFLKKDIDYQNIIPR